MTRIWLETGAFWSVVWFGLVEVECKAGGIFSFVCKTRLEENGQVKQGWRFIWDRIINQIYYF